MDCKNLTSSKSTARLGHSSKSCESACPYLVQGTHSFKGNGKGWSLHRCQSSYTDFLLHNSCLSRDQFPIYFILMVNLKILHSGLCYKDSHIFFLNLMNRECMFKGSWTSLKYVFFLYITEALNKPPGL